MGCNTRQHAFRAALPAAVVSGLLASALGACGGGSPTSASGIDKPASLLEKAFGSESERTEKEQRVAALVATCMQEKGWDYVAVPGGGAFAQSVDTFGTDPEFVKNFGYGISTSIGPDGRPSGVGIGGIRATDAPKDPNASYVESLSESERAAYYTDLMGAPPPSADSANGGIVSATPVFSSADSPAGAIAGGPSGCEGEARRTVYGATGAPHIDQEALDLLEELRQRVDADPRIVKARAAWAACMADAGYNYSNQQDILSDLSGQLNTLMGGPELPGGSEGGLIVVVPGADPGGKPLDIDAAELAKLQAFEKAVAKSDADCRKERVGDLETEVRSEIETELVNREPGR